MNPDSSLDGLAGRAARARQDLNALTISRPVPPPPAIRPSRPSAIATPAWLRSPLAAGLTVAVFVLGVLVGIGTMRDRDRPTGGVLASVSAGDKPSSVATDGRTVWVADAGSGRVIAYDLATLKTLWTVAVGPRPVALTYGLGAVWVVDAGDRELRKLSPSDGRLIGHANTSLDPIGVTTADRVWVLAAGNATADGYDPQTLMQDRSAPGLAGSSGLAADSNGVWVVAGGQLHRVPAAGGDGTVVDLGSTVDLVAIGPDTVWATADDRELLAVDPATGTVKSRIALPGKASAIAAGPNGAAVATDDGSITWVARPGVPPVLLSRPGAVVTSLAFAGHQLVGSSPDSGLLYRMEIAA
jgi:DNA-binding beta-propeller fold protein YncE